MARNTSWGKLGLLTLTRARESAPGFDFAANVMHVDADTICAKCLRWVTPDAIVRRTAYGLIQHEACTTVGPAVPLERV